MSRYEEVERIGSLVADQLSACVEGTSLAINSQDGVFATINRGAQFVWFHLVNNTCTHDAMFQVLNVKIAFFNEQLYFFRVVVSSGGNQCLYDPEPSARTMPRSFLFHSVAPELSTRTT